MLTGDQGTVYTDHLKGLHEWPFWWAPKCAACNEIFTRRQDDKFSKSTNTNNGGK